MSQATKDTEFGGGNTERKRETCSGRRWRLLGLLLWRDRSAPESALGRLLRFGLLDRALADRTPAAHAQPFVETSRVEGVTAWEQAEQVRLPVGRLGRIARGRRLVFCGPQKFYESEHFRKQNVGDAYRRGRSSRRFETLAVGSAQPQTEGPEVQLSQFQLLSPSKP